jgi:actin-related protein 6
MLSLSFFSVLFCATLAHAKVLCYPAGPIVPAPRNLAASCVFKEAVDNLTKAYDDAVKASLKVDWPIDNVSFSVAVVSLHQTEAHVPIWEYHHLAEGNTKGTRTLDRDSQWLIGSISKVFTDYLMLRSGIDIDKSVVEYLTELRNMSSKMSWNDVTLKMLGSHLAGVTADCKFLLTLCYWTRTLS